MRTPTPLYSLPVIAPSLGLFGVLLGGVLLSVISLGEALWTSLVTSVLSIRRGIGLTSLPAPAARGGEAGR